MQGPEVEVAETEEVRAEGTAPLELAFVDFPEPPRSQAGLLDRNDPLALQQKKNATRMKSSSVDLVKSG